MVEQGRRPPHRGMAGRAIHRVAATLKLSSVDVLVTADTAFRRGLEGKLPGTRVQDPEPVAIQAAEGAVGAGQLESGEGVIEGFQLAPGAEHVTGFAERIAAARGGSQRYRPVAGVGIAVASRARQVREVVLARAAFEVVVWPVAVAAGHRGVGVFQGEGRRLVPRQAEGGGLESVDGVALFADVRPRPARELTGVGIAMAVRAGPERRVVVGVWTGRRVAPGAGHSLVLAGQGKRRGRVARLRKSRRLEPMDRVAGAAFPVVRALSELALVGIVAVAVDAPRVGHFRLEVGIPMALHTGEPFVLAVQRKPGLTVVERARREPHLAPHVGVVAGFAAGGEGAVMRVLVAAGALGEAQPGVLDHLGVGGCGAMALGARRVLVTPGQREMGSGVIERLDRRPVRKAVASLAVGTELTRVAVFVTGQAGGVQPLESASRTDHDVLAVGFGNMPGIVALRTLQRGVPPLQGVAGLAVVEVVLRRRPANDSEVLAVVLGVAARAIEIAGCAVDDSPVVALVLRHQRVNLQMAGGTAQLGRACAEDVATTAFERAVHRLMRFGKRTGRDLRTKGEGREK